MTHGWSGSVIEMLGVVDPLTNPAHGGRGRNGHRLRGGNVNTVLVTDQIRNWRG